MKILHVCLAAFYIDGYGYQENILPKMHKLQGHSLEILASTENYIDKKLGYVKPSSYENEDGIRVTRIPYIKLIPHIVAKKLRLYNGISQKLNNFRPDIIFLHDLQFLSIKDIVKYRRKYPNVRIFVDGHTDFVNSGKNWISKNILHKIIYKYCAKLIEPHTEKFYPTLPLRADFFNVVYDIPYSKMVVLPLGIDDSVIDFSKRDVIRQRIRKKFNFSDEDMVIVTGGKIDRRKNIHHLIKAIRNINHKNIKLLLFGMASEEMKNKIDSLIAHSSVHFIGWITPKETYDYLFASDLAFFPGSHSVLWEQAVGIGLPCIFKQWNGIQHIDLGGNCLFVKNGNIEEIQKIILGLYKNKHNLKKMREIALDKGIKAFSYSEIARRAIEKIK